MSGPEGDVEPKNDIERLLQDLCDLEDAHFETTSGGSLFFTYLYGKHGPPRLWISTGSDHHWFRVDGEQWGLWSRLDAVKRVRFVREPDSHAPGKETLSIRLVGLNDEPSLTWRLRPLYDEQGKPIAAQFARWEELRRKYGGRDEMPVENGRLTASVEGGS